MIFFRESLRQWRQPVPEQLTCEQELEKALMVYIKAHLKGHEYTDGQRIDDVAIHQVATYLQQAQVLGKQYAARYVELPIHSQEAVIGAEIGVSLLDRAKNLIQRALTWAKDLFASKVDALGDDASSDDIESAIEDVAENVAETLGLTEIQSIVEETVQSEFVAAGIGQIEAVNEPGACAMCVANADAGPINIGDTFPSGDTNTPFHDRCRCHTVPAGTGG